MPDLAAGGARSDATSSPDELLAVLRSTAFVPGTNVRGQRAGAPWTFLLPSIELGRVLVVGRPGHPAEATLRRLAEHLDIVDELGPDASESHDLVAAVADRIRDAPAFVVAAARRLRPGGVLFLLAAPDRADAMTAAATGEGLRIVLQGEARPPRGELVAALSGGSPSIAPLVDRLGLVPRRASIAVPVPRWIPSRLAPLVRRVVRLRHRVVTAVRDRVAARGPRLALVLVRPGGAVSAVPATTGAAGPPDASTSQARTTSSSIPDPLPAWLRRLAEPSVRDLEGRPWAFVARGDYDSQKPVVVIADARGERAEIVVKVTRSPVWNGRLENERRALDRLALVEHAWTRLVVPRVLFGGTHAGLAVLGESAVVGEPFERSVRGAGLEPLDAAVDAFIELGVATSRPVAGAAHAAALAPLVERFATIWPLPDGERRVLDRDLEVIAGVRELPAVMVHGDAGTWNLVRTPSGAVGALDWEAAEIAGPPLWDVERLVEAWAMLDRTDGARSAMARATRHLVDGSPLSPVLGDALRRSASALAVPDEAIAPLVRLAWVARALKEANRLRPNELGLGRHRRLVRRTVTGPGDGWRILTGHR